MTNINRSEDSVKDASGIALNALAWVLSDDARAQRFLGLTGLTPDSLRTALGDPETHRAVLDFLCSHEPDLVAAAESLDLKPAELAAARDRIAA
jgi:hypothetical protein